MKTNMKQNMLATSISIHEQSACAFCRCVLFFRYL